MCYLLIFVHSRLFPPPTHFLLQMFPHFTTFSHTFRVQGCRPLRAGSALHLPCSPLREMGDRSVCERRSRGREKVLACGREKVQQHGRGSGCRCILGKGEQRLVSRVDVGVKVEEVGWLYVCSRMECSDMSVCTQLRDGRAHRAGTCVGFEEGACSKPECSQDRGPAKISNNSPICGSANQQRINIHLMLNKASRGLQLALPPSCPTPVLAAPLPCGAQPLVSRELYRCC